MYQTNSDHKEIQELKLPSQQDTYVSIKSELLDNFYEVSGFINTHFLNQYFYLIIMYSLGDFLRKSCIQNWWSQ